MLLNVERTQKFIEALESGQFTQAKHCWVSGNNSGCALGVAALCANRESTTTFSLRDQLTMSNKFGCPDVGSTIRAIVHNYYGFSQELMSILVSLNDGIQCLPPIEHKFSSLPSLAWEWSWFPDMTVAQSSQHKIRSHSFKEIANLLKIRLRAQQEFLGVSTAQPLTAELVETAKAKELAPVG